MMNNVFAHRLPTALPADFVLIVLDEIAAIGESPDQVLVKLKLPYSLIDLRSAKTPVVSRHQFVRIYRKCVTLLSNHANRECDLPPMSKDEVDMLCYCVINCKTLGQVIERAANFCRMLGGRAAKLSLESRGNEVVFQMETQRLSHSTSGLLTDLTGLSFYHRLFSWLIGEPIPIAGYAVTYENRSNCETLLRLFHQPIFFAQPVNYFSFSVEFLHKPVVRSYRRLEELLSVFAFDLSIAPSANGQFSEAVEQLILGQLTKGEKIPTHTQFASFFNVSSATFRRRLAEEGIGLTDIKERCRYLFAIELLAPDARLKIADVAMRLGFSDSRSFRRAFRSWTGLSPNEYRHQGQAD